MSLPFRPLGTVKEMLEQIGMDISYAYEDLIFLEHNHFLLQFGEEGAILFFYANVETPADASVRLFDQVRSAAVKEGLTLLHRGRYRVSMGKQECLTLEFLEDDHSAVNDKPAH